MRTTKLNRGPELMCPYSVPAHGCTGALVFQSIMLKFGQSSE